MNVCFNNDADVSPVTIGMRKGFVLKEYVDKILHRFIEGGFIQLWQRQTFRLYKMQHSRNAYAKINFDFFKAPLFCWSVGVILALGVFVLENVTSKYKMHRMVRRYKN